MPPPPLPAKALSSGNSSRDERTANTVSDNVVARLNSPFIPRIIRRPGYNNGRDVYEGDIDQHNRGVLDNTAQYPARVGCWVRVDKPKFEIPCELPEHRQFVLDLEPLGKVKYSDWIVDAEELDGIGHMAEPVLSGEELEVNKENVAPPRSNHSESQRDVGGTEPKSNSPQSTKTITNDEDGSSQEQFEDQSVEGAGASQPKSITNSKNRRGIGGREPESTSPESTKTIENDDEESAAQLQLENKRVGEEEEEGSSQPNQSASAADQILLNLEISRRVVVPPLLGLAPYASPYALGLEPYPRETIAEFNSAIRQLLEIKAMGGWPGAIHPSARDYVPDDDPDSEDEDAFTWNKPYEDSSDDEDVLPWPALDNGELDPLMDRMYPTSEHVARNTPAFDPAYDRAVLITKYSDAASPIKKPYRSPYPPLVPEQVPDPMEVEDLQAPPVPLFFMSAPSLEPAAPNRSEKEGTPLGPANPQTLLSKSAMAVAALQIVNKATSHDGIPNDQFQIMCWEHLLWKFGPSDGSGTAPAITDSLGSDVKKWLEHMIYTNRKKRDALGQKLSSGIELHPDQMLKYDSLSHDLTSAQERTEASRCLLQASEVFGPDFRDAKSSDDMHVAPPSMSPTSSKSEWYWDLGYVMSIDELAAEFEHLESGKNMNETDENTQKDSEDIVMQGVEPNPDMSFYDVLGVEANLRPTIEAPPAKRIKMGPSNNIEQRDQPNSMSMDAPMDLRKAKPYTPATSGDITPFKPIPTVKLSQPHHTSLKTTTNSALSMVPRSMHKPKVTTTKRGKTNSKTNTNDALFPAPTSVHQQPSAKSPLKKSVLKAAATSHATSRTSAPTSESEWSSGEPTGRPPRAHPLFSVFSAPAKGEPKSITSSYLGDSGDLHSTQSPTTKSFSRVPDKPPAKSPAKSPEKPGALPNSQESSPSKSNWKPKPLEWIYHPNQLKQQQAWDYPGNYAVVISTGADGQSSLMPPSPSQHSQGHSPSRSMGSSFGSPPQQQTSFGFQGFGIPNQPSPPDQGRHSNPLIGLEVSTSAAPSRGGRPQRGGRSGRGVRLGHHHNHSIFDNPRTHNAPGFAQSPGLSPATRQLASGPSPPTNLYQRAQDQTPTPTGTNKRPFSPNEIPNTLPKKPNFGISSRPPALPSSPIALDNTPIKLKLLQSTTPRKSSREYASANFKSVKARDAAAKRLDEASKTKPGYKNFVELSPLKGSSGWLKVSGPAGSNIRGLMKELFPAMNWEATLDFALD